MLYNIDKKEIRTLKTCLECEHFCKNKKCNGIGKSCFEYDSKTKTIIDTITKMPIKLSE